MESLEDEVRTEKQKEADDNLLNAIQQALEAYGLVEQGFLLGDYVVLTALNRLASQGVIQTKHPMLFRDGDIPWYRVAGLLSQAKIEVSLAISAGNDNG